VTNLSIRCSALPRIANCQASAIPPTVEIGWKNEMADLGTVGHFSIAGFITGKPVLLAELAAQYGVDVDDAKRVFSGLAAAWDKVKDWFPDPQVEVPMSWTDDFHGITLTGTTDLLSLSDGIAKPLDWKSGFTDRDAEYQVKGYALLACMTFGNEAAEGYQINSRLGNAYKWEWSRSELLQWWDVLADAIRKQADKPVAGTHCQFCPRWAECLAGRSYLRQAAQAIMELEAANGLPADQLIAISEQRKMVEAACKTVQELLRVEVNSRGGKVEHTDGRRYLEMVNTVRREIDFDKGMPVVMDALGERWKEAGEFSKTTAEKIISEGAPRGHKGRAIEAFHSALDEAGALGAFPQSKLELRRKK
jgi:hypothetical protein